MLSLALFFSQDGKIRQMPEIFNADDQVQPEKTSAPAPQSTQSAPAQSTSEPDSLNEAEKTAIRKSRPVESYSDVMRYESASNNPLRSFIPKPSQIFFDSQARDEKVILLLRKSLITQIPWVIMAVLLIFAPILFGAVGLLSFLPARFEVAGIIVWYLLVTGYILESFLSWFFNVYIITDERIIDVDFLSLIYKNVSAAKIDNIEDVTTESGGAVRSLFNFGTVKIQTASANAELEFEDVPQPAKVTRLINELLLEEEREKIEGRVN